jgi:hypothetical protein
MTTEEYYRIQLVNLARQLLNYYHAVELTKEEMVAAGITLADQDATNVLTSSIAVNAFVKDNFHLTNFVRGADYGAN